jgi:uncharacterized membrane protein (DUF106 family)
MTLNTPKSVRSLLNLLDTEAFTMETEILGIVLGTVLPIYPLLFVIHQKIGRYDEIVDEFKKLRDEHERFREAYHGG